MTQRRGPKLIEDLDDLPPAPATPAEAPEIDPAPPARATQAAIAVAARRPSLIGRVFWSALLGFLSLALGLWFWETAEALIARNIWLGRFALGLGIVAAGALLLLALREAAALSRIRRIDGIRAEAEAARAATGRDKAADALSSLDALYRARPEMGPPRDRLSAAAQEVLDGDALLDVAERELLHPLDDAAEAAVRKAARSVAAATALIPLALVDVLAALVVNLRMIREIAEIYGGRAGWLGSWRLLRAVAAHLVAAGALAVGDDVIGPALGGGVLSKLSRRFGEGLVNGALTARIGVAAIEVCRPLPFHTRARPGVGGLIKGALGDLTGSGGKD